MQIDTLLRVCQSLDINEEEVKKVESLSNYHLLHEINGDKLRQISIRDLDALIEAFGDSISVKIGVTDGPPLLEIKNGKSDNSLNSFLEDILDDTSFKLSLDINIDKFLILKQIGMLNDNYNSVYYLFTDNLINFLKSSLIDLDDKLFSKRCKPTVIIISDSTIYYQGPTTVIIGVSLIELIKGQLISIDKEWIEWINKYYKTIPENLNWMGFELKRITPLHFYCERKEGYLDQLELLLAAHMLNTLIIYTANRTNYNGSEFQSSFSSSERTITIEFKAKGDNLWNLQSIFTDLPNDIKNLLRFVQWPYAEKGTDRLIILQNVISRELGDTDTRDYYKAFIKLLPRILNEARWHHRVFVDNKIDNHFEQMQEVTDYIAKIAEEVSQTLDTMTKGLTDTLLATIGIAILSLLTSLTRENMSYTIFSELMKLYAIYLFVFQVLYRMGSTLHSYRFLEKETDHQLELYTHVFGKDKMDKISSSLINRRKQFIIWFIITVTIYLMVSIFIWVIGNSLPQYLSQLSISNSTMLTRGPA